MAHADALITPPGIVVSYCGATDSTGRNGPNNNGPVLPTGPWKNRCVRTLRSDQWKKKYSRTNTIAGTPMIHARKYLPMMCSLYRSVNGSMMRPAWWRRPYANAQTTIFFDVTRLSRMRSYDGDHVQQ
jgi:hypothetical protein